jgi:hypothetical protein
MSEVVNNGTSAQRFRQYAIDDAQGDVTGIVDYEQLPGQTSPSWQVVERYEYSPYGSITFLNPDWTASATPGESTRGWEYFFQDMRYNFGDGLYHTGGQAYDPFFGRTMQPNMQLGGTNPYTLSQTYGTSDSPWLDALSHFSDDVDESAANRGTAIWGAAKQFGYTIADLANDYVFDATYINRWVLSGFTDTSGGIQFYKGNLSALGQGLENGSIDPLSGRYVGQSLYGAVNAMSFGTIDQGWATVQGLAGNISMDEWADRVAVGGAGQLVAAATLPAGANIDVGALVSRVGAYGGAFYEGIGSGGSSVYMPSGFGGAQAVAQDAIGAYRYAKLAVAEMVENGELRVISPRQAGFGGVGGRLGNAATRDQLLSISAELIARGYRIRAGGGFLPEEFLRGSSGGSLGAGYPDLTAVNVATGRIIRINTVTTLADGVTPTAEELINAANIRRLSGGHLILIPKVP